MGLNNIELISDRPLQVNLDEMAAVKKRFPDRALIASLMTETRDDWRVLIRRVEDTGCDGLELNFGCPHGMCERGMGSSVGQEPKLLEEITSWAKEFSKTKVLVKLTPQHRRHHRAGRGGDPRRRRRPVAHQHHQEPGRRRSRAHGATASRGPRARPTAGIAAPR